METMNFLSASFHFWSFIVSLKKNTARIERHQNNRKTVFQDVIYRFIIQPNQSKRETKQRKLRSDQNIKNLQSLPYWHSKKTKHSVLLWPFFVSCSKTKEFLSLANLYLTQNIANIPQGPKLSKHNMTEVPTGV